jgi:hypothetical protein
MNKMISGLAILLFAMSANAYDGFGDRLPQAPVRGGADCLLYTSDCATGPDRMLHGWISQCRASVVAIAHGRAMGQSAYGPTA